MNIVAVDWDPCALRLLSGYLAELLPQAEIDTFTDPFWAVKHVYHNRVDMVFTEIKMRGLDGADVIRLVRGRGAALIPVFYVAESEEAFQKACGRTPVTGFLKKPVAKDELRALIAEALHILPPGKGGRGAERVTER